MSDRQWKQLIDLLAETKRIQFDVGLTDNAIPDIDQTNQYRFPPDRALQAQRPHRSTALCAPMPQPLYSTPLRYETHSPAKTRLSRQIQAGSS